MAGVGRDVNNRTRTKKKWEERRGEFEWWLWTKVRRASLKV